MSATDIVARTIWGEARSLGYEGMHAVANVIMNRYHKKTWYGLTPIAVCLRNEKGVYQFDCNDPKDPNYKLVQAATINDPQYSMAMKIAIDSFSDDFPDITNGATHYYSETIPMPYWAKDKDPCFIVGNTKFFNNIDG